jgi:hypothetical protein
MVTPFLDASSKSLEVGDGNMQRRVALGET